MMRRNNRGNINDIDMELAMIKRRRQMIQEQRQMLEECDQLERLQGQAGNWQQNMRYNNIQQPFNQFDGNAFNQYPSAYDNNSNGYQRHDDYQNNVWQHNAAPKPQMYGNSSFNERDYQMNGPQPILPGNDVRPHFNRNVNRIPGPQRQQPRFANAAKPISAKSKMQFVQGKVMKPKVVANPLNKSKFPKKLGPGYAGPVWEGGVRGPRQVAPMVHDNTYLVTKKAPNPKLHGRLELCLGEILREVRESVESSAMDIRLTLPLVKTIKEYIRNRIRKTMIGKHAHTVSYVLNLYRNRHPRSKDVMFVKNLKDMLLKEAARAGAGTVSNPASKSLNKDSVKQKPVEAADKTDDNKETDQQDEETKEWAFQKMHTQTVTSAQLNKLLLKLNDLIKAESKEEGQEEGNTDENQTAEEEIKTEGEGEGATGEEGEGMEVEKKEEATAPKDEKMVRLERLIEQRLPFILPRFKNLILAILNNEPIPKHYTSTFKSRLYMVKLFGRPNLPKRHLLANFLLPYNVLNIKKLKTRGNLLIIGCGTEEDRDRLLAASGTTIENFKLHIKAFHDTRNPSSPNQTNGDAAAAANDDDDKDMTAVEETEGEQNDTVDLCDENGDENDTEQAMAGDEGQNGQADGDVIDVDAQDDAAKAEPVAETGQVNNPVQEIKKEVVTGTASKPVMTRRSSRFPK